MSYSQSSPIPKLAGGYITNETIQSKISITSRQCKIIGTIGPACESVEQLQLLMDCGMNTALLEMSYYSSHRRHSNAKDTSSDNDDKYAHYTTIMDRIRVAADKTQRNIAIWIDLMGAEIFTGKFANDINEIQFVKGNIVVLATHDPYFLACDATKIACSYRRLASVVKPGQQILVADGALVLTVIGTDTTYGEVACRIENTTTLSGERRNMCIPNLDLSDLPTISERDIDDIVQFVIPHDVDFVSIGYLRNGAQDIINLRQLLSDHGKQHIKIIAKIDNIQSLVNLQGIINAADGIVVNRGELGMNLPSHKVFLAQKHIIRECNIYGKPVSVATQLLNSMISNPRPTRAECSDVANAVLDGADSIILSRETAIGQYGQKAVQVMARTICEAESSRNFNAIYTAIQTSVLHRFNDVISATESLASSAVKTAIDVDAKLIVVLSQTGRAARYIAKYRPGRFIICLTTSPIVARQTSGYLKGVHSYLVGSFNKDYILAQETGREAIKVGIAKPHDLMVIVCGNIQEDVETANANTTGTKQTANYANQVRVESILEPQYDTETGEMLPLPGTRPRQNTLSKLQSFEVAYKDIV